MKIHRLISLPLLLMFGVGVTAAPLHAAAPSHADSNLSRQSPVASPQTSPQASPSPQSKAASPQASPNPQSKAASPQASPSPTSPAQTPQLISQAGVLRQGDSGEAVTELQQRLTSLAYYQGAITGFFGEQTRSAVELLQRDQGLTVDGIVGAGTQSVIQRLLNEGRQTPDPEVRTVLRLNDTGEQVAELQRRLTQLRYYSGAITGTFGPVTEAAVITFQRANNLTPDGIVGAGTADVLRRPASDIAPPPSAVTPPATDRPSNPPAPTAGLLRRGSTGAQVVDLQNRLRALGFYNGPLNGNFGPQTEAAVIAFQRSQGLDADGIVGSQVEAALQRAQSTGTRSNSNSNSNSSASDRTLRPSATEVSSDRYSVAELQRRLQNRGYNPGEVNGVLNEQTQRAIGSAQRDRNLSPEDLTSN